VNAWRVKKGVARWQALLALAVVALAAAFAAWLALPRVLPPSPGAGEGAAKPPAKPAQILASIEVEGHGLVLANGTSQLLWNSTKPFTLLLEAKPERCWSFKGWLVNGSLYSVELNATLTVKGNTTVKAVFELPVYTVSIVPVLLPAQAANASARVNGTLYLLPAEVSALACSLLEIEPVAPRGWKALNGTLLVNGSAEVKLVFEKVAAVIKMRNLVVPARVSGLINGTSTGTTVGGAGQPEVELAVAFGSQVFIEPAGDRKGCILYNDTHLACFDGWIVNGTRYGGTQLGFTARGDTLVEMQAAITKKQHPVAYTEVLLPNGSYVKVPVIPGEQYLIIPFYGEYEYVGNGWFKIKGVEKSGRTAYSFIILLPESWKRIRVTANYTRFDEHAATPSVEVICKHLTAGVDLAPVYLPRTEVNVFEIDRSFVDCVGDTRFNPIPSAPENEIVLKCMNKHFKSLTSLGGPSIRGTSVRTFNVPVGSLLITGEDGIIYLKIEILEARG